jgi:hypothetical protein
LRQRDALPEAPAHVRVNLDSHVRPFFSGR